MINPKTYYFSFARFIPLLLLISVASMAAALLWMLSYSDTTAIGQADIYWVFYLHIAATIVALICYTVMAVSSLMHFEQSRGADADCDFAWLRAKRLCDDDFCVGLGRSFRSSPLGRLLDLGLAFDRAFDFALLLCGFHLAFSFETFEPPGG